MIIVALQMMVYIMASELTKLTVPLFFYKKCQCI
jgi:hypothetical protein